MFTIVQVPTQKPAIAESVPNSSRFPRSLFPSKPGPKPKPKNQPSTALESRCAMEIGG